MIKDFLKNNWIVTVGGGVLTVFLLRLIDWLFINDFFWDGIKGFSHTVLGFLNTAYSIKLYWLILIPITPLLLLYGHKRLKTRAVSLGTVTIDASPDWLSYTKDVFEGVQYRWGYEFDHYRKNYVIINVTPYCNACSCQLVLNKCPNCGKYYFDASSWAHGDLKSSSEVEALAIHRIENGLYKKQ